MHPLVSLAKLTVETYIEKREVINIPKDVPKDFLTKKAGVFVTIKNNKQLRGCIGTYMSTKENIAKEVIPNAIAAASQDYRFDSIRTEELPYLSYTVSVLSEPKQIKDISELNPKKYGIIIKTNEYFQKCGLLLPDLEGVETVGKQVSIACQKAGINPDNERFLIYKFTVEKYED